MSKKIGMQDFKDSKKWRELQATYMLHVFEQAVGRPARTMQELEKWVSEGNYQKPTVEDLIDFAEREGLTP